MREDLNIKKMSEVEATEILGWTYRAPYDFYNNTYSPEAVKEMIEGSYYTVFAADKGIIGFFCTGSAAQVPNDSYSYSDDYMDIGIGMKPEYTGQGNGRSFLAAVFSELQISYENQPKRLTVAKFNRRAQSLYEKFGFRMKHEFSKGSTEFIVMIQSN